MRPQISTARNFGPRAAMPAGRLICATDSAGRDTVEVWKAPPRASGPAAARYCKRRGLLDRVAEPGLQLARVVPVRRVRVAVAVRVTPQTAARLQVRVGDAPAPLEAGGELLVDHDPGTKPEVEVEKRVGIELPFDWNGVEARVG